MYYGYFAPRSLSSLPHSWWTILPWKFSYSHAFGGGLLLQYQGALCSNNGVFCSNNGVVFCSNVWSLVLIPDPELLRLFVIFWVTGTSDIELQVPWNFGGDQDIFHSNEAVGGYLESLWMGADFSGPIPWAEDRKVQSYLLYIPQGWEKGWRVSCTNC